MKNKTVHVIILLGFLAGAGRIVCAESMVLYTSADTAVLGEAPAANHGSQTGLRIRHSVPADWGNSYVLAKFDLSSLPALGAGESFQINSVRMRFFAGLAGWPAGATNFVPIAMCNNLGDWDESVVTFNTKPAFDGVPVETLDHFGLMGVDDIPFTGTNNITNSGWLEYVGPGTRDLVQGWVDGSIPNFGVSVKGSEDYLGNDSRIFLLQAKENPAASVHPRLIVDYDIYTEPVGYDAWADGWGVYLGSKTDDYDNDGLFNLYEYGLGGDPTNELDQGTAPTFEIVDLGGSNVVHYLHPQLSNPSSGLNYFLELNTNLVDGSWSNEGYTIKGTNVTGSSLDFVTNITDTVADKKFIRLIIEPQASFNVKNYGAQGDGNADDTPAILSAIAAANAVGSSAEVIFPSGIYRISSTNDHALQLYNISDVRLKGYGTNSVLLISNPEVGGISFTDSTNVAVQGLTIDYDPLPFTQGTITAVNTAGGTFDLLIDPGYPLLSHPAFSNSDVKTGIMVDLERETSGPWAYRSSNWTSLGGQGWRMTAEDPALLQAHPLVVGDRYAHMARSWTFYDIMANFCVGVEIKEVTIHASAGLTTGLFYSSGVVIDGLRVELKPGSTRLLSSNGDCVHAGGCPDGLLIENCNFVGMADDGINIHGRGGVTISNVTDTIKRIGTPRVAFFAAGDEVQFLNNAAGGIRGNAILVDAVQLNSVVWEITLDTPMPGLNASWSAGDKLNSISRCGQGSIIRNNFIGAHIGRDLLIRSHDVVITNNYFYNPSLGWRTVSLHDDYTYYSEGPAAYNIGIYGNTFEGGTNQWSWSGASIGIYSVLSGGTQSPTYDSWNIEIKGNTFINIDGPAVEAASVTGMQITDNTVTTTLGIKLASSPVILLENANDIQIDNLDVTDPNPATYAGVHIRNTVPSVPGAVVIVDLTANLAPGKPDVLDDR